MKNIVINKYKKNNGYISPRSIKIIIFFLISAMLIGGLFIMNKYNKKNAELIKQMLEKISRLDEDKKVYSPLLKTNGVYYVANNKVYFKTNNPISSPYTKYPADKVVSTDVKNFRGYFCALGEGFRCDYGIDSTSVYYKNKKIDNLDKISFELVLDKKGEFIKDKKHVYSFDGKNIIKDADPSSFELIEDGGTSHTDLAIDNNFLFQRGNEGIFVKNNEIDRKSLEILYRDHVVTYIKDKNSVFYKNRDDGYIKKIPGADTESFVNINQKFSKDCNFVFFWNNHLIEKIKNIDPESFQHISGYWYKDLKHIYFVEYTEIAILQNADPNNFEIIKGNVGASLDTVYYKNRAMKNIDRKTFKQVGKSYFFVDKNNLYVYSNGIEKIDISSVDPSSFYQIGTQYFKDNNQVYFYDHYKLKAVQDADLETFTPICYECVYAKDKNNKFRGADKDDF